MAAHSARQCEGWEQIGRPEEQLCVLYLSYEQTAKLNPHPKNISVPEADGASPGKGCASKASLRVCQLPAAPLPSANLLGQRKQIHSSLYLGVVRHVGTTPRRPRQISRGI